jgi:hypothetical protein
MILQEILNLGNLVKRRIFTMWKNLGFTHPVFFALFPVLALYAINFSKFKGSQIIFSFFILVIIAILLMLIGWLRSRDLDKAAFLSSLIVFLFMNYGHVYVGLRGFFEDHFILGVMQSQIDWLRLGAHLFLIPSWFLLFFLGYNIFNRFIRWKRQATRYLFLLSILSLIIPLARILRNKITMEAAYGEGILITKEAVRDFKPVIVESKPDIYYIILDAYGRGDILQEFYDYNNSYFIDHLEDMGFFIARESRSNYSNTNRSVASSLNMTYFDGDMAIPDEDVLCEKFLTESISFGEVIQILKGLGYRIVSFATGYPTTEMQETDLYLSPENPGMNAFERLLIQRSMLLPVFEFASSLNLPLEYPGYRAHRERIRFVLDWIPDVSEGNEPIFVFAHIVAPHPPFVFDSKGEAVIQGFPYAMGDGNVVPGTREDYRRGYTEQLAYINTAILNMLRQLTQDSLQQPVILLQGDHGPRSVMEWGSPSSDAMREAMAILNAYYLPGADTSSLYDKITPVNSYRVLFNTYFNMGYEILPDRSYFTSVGCQNFSITLPEEVEAKQGQE